MSTREAVAWHESCHAIIANELGLKVTGVSVRLSESGWSGRTSIAAAEDPWADAVSLWAGVLGTRLNGSEGVADLSHDWRALCASPLDSEERAAARRVAESLVRQHWDQIQRLAAKLQRHPELELSEP